MGTRTAFHNEVGSTSRPKVYKIQVRPDPLAVILARVDGGQRVADGLIAEGRAELGIGRGIIVRDLHL